MKKMKNTGLHVVGSSKSRSGGLIFPIPLLFFFLVKEETSFIYTSALNPSFKLDQLASWPSTPILHEFRKAPRNLRTESSKLGSSGSTESVVLF